MRRRPSSTDCCLALLVLAWGCSSNRVAPPDAFDSDAATHSGDSGSRDGDGPGAARAGWVDVHTHLDHATFDPVKWKSFLATLGSAGAVVLSGEHWTVSARMAGAPPSTIEEFEQRNEELARAVSGDPTLFFFPSLECWHDVPFSSAGWVDACKADVDHWIDKGARGFKDHIGKQFAPKGEDTTRWLGAWNRDNGFCTVVGGGAEPNRECMTQTTVRYPAYESKWRQVLAYITDTHRLPVLTHATSAGGDEQCFDPVLKAVRPCTQVTRRVLLELAGWAKGSLPVAARRRIVVAHLGWFTRVDTPGTMADMLDAGLSTETAANIFDVADLGCAGRVWFEKWPDQILFGTDVNTGECAGMYQAWRHVLTGDIKEVQHFETCWGPADVRGMDLDSPRVTGCAHDVPEGTVERIQRQNFDRLYE